MVELLGLENLTNAFGLCLMFTGVSATVGGPLASRFTFLKSSVCFDVMNYE